MSSVRVGIIGLGVRGKVYAESIYNKSVEGAELTAICDIDERQLEWAEKHLPDNVRRYSNSDDLILSGEVDGVIIVTPHYSHPPIAIEAFKNNLHVLIDKPSGVYTEQVKEMNAEAEKSGRVFSILFLHRTNPIYQKARNMVMRGDLGEIKRTNWIITDRYRPQSYYNSADWRSTWEGEGGGVLINQSVHQLDIWQWICGMPVRVWASCKTSFHDIEVEDDVSAFVEYGNGATGIFITSTGDWPGTNRFEISGEMGKLVIEDDKIVFWRLKESERKFNEEYEEPFGNPGECERIDIPVTGEYTNYNGIISGWINAIREGKPLLAPGDEGINSLELLNAMYLSSWIERFVDIPVDEKIYYKKLKEKMK